MSEQHIVIGIPRSLLEELKVRRLDAIKTSIEEVDAACVVLFQGSWDQCQSYHNRSGGLNLRGRYDHTMARGTSDPRWAKLLSQVVTVKRHPGRKRTDNGSVVQRQQQRDAVNNITLDDNTFEVESLPTPDAS